MKQFVTRSFLVLILMLPFVFAPFNVAADARNAKATYEVVLVVDASSSMRHSDPQKLAYEALKTFAAMYPSQSNMYLSVVSFNNTASVVVERVNVSDADEMETYIKLVSGNMPVRDGGTDTGLALQKARNIMDRSTADQKAIVLFTDGATQVTTGSTTTAKSIQLSKELATYFGQQNIPMYCAGLDERGTSIDEDFLRDLANRSSGQYLRCHSASEINSLFIKIFADFMGVEDTDDELELQPDVDTTYTADIYGQAIMEANVNLFSNAAISHFQVTDPSGKCVASYNAATGVLDVNANVCEIIKSDSDYVFNIKIKKPSDGNWTVTMRSKTAGKVIISRVQLYNIDILTSLGEEVGVNTAMALDFHLFNNDTQSRITTERIYKQSECEVQVLTANNTLVSEGKATLNSTQNGYRYNMSGMPEGKYLLVCRVKNTDKQFSVEKTIPFEVVKDAVDFTASHIQMELPVTRCYVGEQYTVTTFLTDPVTGNRLSRVPEQFADCTFKLFVRGARDITEIHSFRASDFRNGSFTAKMTALKAGSYEFDIEAYNAQGQGIGGVVAVSSQTLTVDPCTVSIELPATPDFYNGENATVVFKDAQGRVLTELPAGFANAQLKIEMYRGSELRSTKILKLSDFREGRGTFQFEAPEMGSYSFHCTLLNNEQSIVYDSIPFQVSDELIYTPQISLPSGTIPFESGISITTQIKDLGGNVISKLPDRYSDMKVEIFVMQGSDVVKTFTLGFSDFSGAQKTVVYAPTVPGNYSVIAKLSRAGKMSISETLTATVAEERLYTPIVSIPDGEITCAGGATITVGFKNFAGAIVNTLPQRYADMQLNLKVMLDGEAVLTKTFGVRDVQNGKISYSFRPEKSGSYTVMATLSLNGDSATAETVTLVFPNSEITVSNDVRIPSIKESNTSGTANKEFDINGLFVDNDGDALTYTVEAEDSKNVEVTIDGTNVQIHVKGFTKSHVTITAQDPYGATATYTVSVQVKSLMPLIIILCVLASLLIVGGIVAFIIIQKRKIINVAFNVKIDNIENGEYVVYNVMKLANKKNVKVKMRLSDILAMENLASVLAGELAYSDDAVTYMAEAGKMELTGLVNRKGFTVKTPKRKLTYTGRQTSVTTGNYMFSFGRPGSFDESMF